MERWGLAASDSAKDINSVKMERWKRKSSVFEADLPGVRPGLNVFKEQDEDS